MPCPDQIFNFFERSSFQGVTSESANSSRLQKTSVRSGLNLRSFRFFLVSFAVGVYSSCLTKGSVRLFLELTEAKWSP